MQTHVFASVVLVVLLCPPWPWLSLCPTALKPALPPMGKLLFCLVQMPLPWGSLLPPLDSSAPQVISPLPR